MKKPPRIDPWYVARYGSTTVELLPCPFCGGKAIYESLMGDIGIHIGCSREKCNTYGPERKTIDAAAKAWNRRHSIPPPPNPQAPTMKERDRG